MSIQDITNKALNTSKLTKVKFDYGLGLTFFGDVNKIQSMIGARFELFFSGAFRGNIRHKEEE